MGFTYTDIDIKKLAFNNHLAYDWQIGFQKAATPIMEGIVHIHQQIMVIAALILFLVTAALYYILTNFVNKETFVKRSLHAPWLEIIWTILPCVILALIGAPSMALLYSMDETFHPYATVKVIGRQWYWTYKYSYDFPNEFVISVDEDATEIVYDSILLNDEDTFKDIKQVNFNVMVQMMREIRARRMLNYQQIFDYKIDQTSWLYRNIIFPLFNHSLANLLTKEEKEKLEEIDRLTEEFEACLITCVGLRQHAEGFLAKLTVDKPMIIPGKKHVRLLITSSDVIHSWAVPSFGIKVDAIPGRTNQQFVFAKENGIFYGQCSELCGVNHAFMPIQVLVMPTTALYKVGIMMLNDDASSVVRPGNLGVDQFFLKEDQYPRGKQQKT